MGDLIDAADYDQIRKAIDTKLTDGQLPDSVIEMDIYLPAGESDVLSEVEIGDLDPEKMEHAKRAAIYYTAARLVYAVIQITSVNVQTRDGAISRRAWDPAKKQEELYRMAEREMDFIRDPAADSGVSLSSVLFARVKGRRGR